MTYTEAYGHSKKMGNDQELIQSNPISHPQNQKGQKHTQLQLFDLSRRTHLF